MTTEELILLMKAYVGAERIPLVPNPSYVQGSGELPLIRSDETVKILVEIDYKLAAVGLVVFTDEDCGVCVGLLEDQE